MIAWKDDGNFELAMVVEAPLKEMGFFCINK